jgi:hypothetical protein
MPKKVKWKVTYYSSMDVRSPLIKDGSELLIIAKKIIFGIFFNFYGFFHEKQL